MMSKKQRDTMRVQVDAHMRDPWVGSSPLMNLVKCLDDLDEKDKELKRNQVVFRGRDHLIDVQGSALDAKDKRIADMDTSINGLVDQCEIYIERIAELEAPVSVLIDSSSANPNKKNPLPLEGCQTNVEIMASKECIMCGDREATEPGGLCRPCRNPSTDSGLCSLGVIQANADILCGLLESADQRGLAVDGDTPDGSGCFNLLNDHERRRFYLAARRIKETIDENGVTP